MGLVASAAGGYRAVSRFVGRRALARAALAVPRTLRLVAEAATSGEVSESVAAPSLSIGFAAGVAMDEALLAMAMTPNRFPRRADYARVAAELAAARDLYAGKGWLEAPAGYHRTPPPLADADVERGRGWASGLSYERLAYDSGFEPRPGEPGGERWAAYAPNHRARATVVRRGPGPAPWVVAVHGFCMGYPFMDFVGLQVPKLRGLGYNVALPVLPLHGPRKVTPVSGEPFLSFDLMNTVHGLAQAVWDIRRLVGWLRTTQGATSVSLYGVSLGAYVVALLAGLDPGIDAVVAGIPVVDFPRLFHEHSPMHIRLRSIEHRIMGGAAEDVFRVVSPLSFAPAVAHDRRFVYAGYGDRLAFPDQARTLWRHWDEPRIEWYPGNHVGYLWSRQVGPFLEEALQPQGVLLPAGAGG